MQIDRWRRILRSRQGLREPRRAERLVPYSLHVICKAELRRVMIGQPASHDEAKEIFAGFAGAFVDREAETRGADYIDREKAKRMAMDQSSDQIQQQGGW